MVAKGKGRVADVGEFGLLKLLQRRFAQPGRGVRVGVGDDAAIIDTVGPGAVLTADTLIEDVDFRLAWASFADVGHKAAAVNLSDLAAMGAVPRAMLLSLAVRPADRVADLLALAAAVDRLGKRHGAALVGGDLSRITEDGPLVVSITAVGEVAPARALRRHRGRPGDWVVVSGNLGGAAAGLSLLETAAGRRGAVVARQLRPTPRVELGAALAAARCVRSCADISDGLGTDAGHIAGPGCGVEIDADRLPVSRAARKVLGDAGRSITDAALGGGEDFELVLAIAPAHLGQAQRVAAKAGTPLSVVGRVVRGRGVCLRDGSPVAAGFDHFA